MTCGSRVHAHAAAALINFCEGVERNTLIPYLDPIVERLLKLLNPTTANPKRYVQEQVITTLAMVADASEATFAKVSSQAARRERDLIQCCSITRRLGRCCSTSSRTRTVRSIGSCAQRRWNARVSLVSLTICFPYYQH